MGERNLALSNPVLGDSVSPGGLWIITARFRFSPAASLRSQEVRTDTAIPGAGLVGMSLSEVQAEIWAGLMYQRGCRIKHSNRDRVCEEAVCQ